jgi:predicted nucleic acid-binding protein
VGTLVLPVTGAVYLDANTLIYRIETIQPYLTTAAPLWDALRAGTQEVVTSVLSLLETLVKPLQLGNATLQKLFETVLYNTKGFACLPVTRQTLEAAAQIRVTYGLKTPDAIHAATALIEGCTLFVTNDLAFQRIPGLNVAILSEIAAAP